MGRLRNTEHSAAGTEKTISVSMEAVIQQAPPGPTPRNAVSAAEFFGQSEPQIGSPQWGPRGLPLSRYKLRPLLSRFGRMLQHQRSDMITECLE
ncbi:hypothetical protein VTN96DRAFT_9991 [Rasamsonia emersonii]